MGDLDLNTVLRLFLYIILYRPTGKAQILYTMVYSPIVVFHNLDPGCLSQDDGLNWIVEEGDLLGVLIPGNCTTPEDLISRNDVNTLNEMELMEFEFCPAQIDLVNDPSQCFHALYLNSTEGTPLDEIESVNFAEIVNVSARLNIQLRKVRSSEVMLCEACVGTKLVATGAIISNEIIRASVDIVQWPLGVLMCTCTM